MTLKYATNSKNRELIVDNEWSEGDGASEGGDGGHTGAESLEEGC